MNRAPSPHPLPPFPFFFRIFFPCLLVILVGASLPSKVAGQTPEAAVRHLSPKDFVVLESVLPGPAKVVAGNPALADKSFCPASTFKIILAWAALERGLVGSETLIRCADPHICPKGADLNLHQALLYSSNDFFRPLASRIGRNFLEEFMIRSGYCAPASLSGWLGKNWAPIVKGGKLRISPRKQHRFMVAILGQICRGGLQTGTDTLYRDAAGMPGWWLPGSDSSSIASPISSVVFPNPVLRQLVPALRWPSPDPRVILFGKTGAAENVVWFTGFGFEMGRPKTVTVFCRGSLARRPAVIATFYRRFGLTWDPALLPTIK